MANEPMPEIESVKIAFRCGHCGGPLSSQLEDAGKKIECPACLGVNFAPGKSEEAGPVARTRPKIDYSQLRASLPKRPYWDGIFKMFFEGRCGLSVIGLALLQGGILFAAVRLAAYGPIAAFFVIPFTTLLVGILLVMLSTICQVILIETTSGVDRMQEWPFVSGTESIFVGLRMFPILIVTLAPGGFAAWIAGVDLFINRLPFLGISAWLCFPIIMLSVLASDSVVEPFSLGVLSTLYRLPLRWIKFYALSIIFALVEWGIIKELFRANAPLDVLFPLLGLSIILTSVLYFRLLGRLAWICSELLEQVAENEGDEE
jgi:hypothetical protein